MDDVTMTQMKTFFANFFKENYRSISKNLLLIADLEKSITF